MIILDTNVLSELMRRDPAPRVLEWAAGQNESAVFTTSISEAEIFYGLALLPKGKRKTGLEQAAGGLFADFSGRVLPFDSTAAREFGDIVAGRRRSGRSISMPDAEIAAIARSRGAQVATRDSEDFTGCGIDLIDPWLGLR